MTSVSAFHGPVVPVAGVVPGHRPHPRRGVALGLRILLGLVAATASSTTHAQSRGPLAAAAMPSDPRGRLDEALRLASERKYGAAIAAFEDVKAHHPEAINGLDGLKMVVVYAEAGQPAKHAALTRWLMERYRTPKTATEAERAVKGYIVFHGATDRSLLARAVEMTRYASDHAEADGEGQYQGFFDTSRGVAEFRMGRFAEAARWFPKTIEHPSLYVRSLALPFYAMTERVRGNRAHAQELYAQALATAVNLPDAGTPEYGVEWTDILIARMAVQEMKTAFGK